MRGSYAKAGRTGFGEGTRSASDFDGADLLVSVAAVAVAVAVAGLGAAAMIAVSLGGNEREPKEPTESARIEYGPFHFDESSVKTVHSQYSDKTYQVELEEIEHGSYVTVVPMMTGKAMAMIPITHHAYTGHFSVTDMGTMEKTRLDIGNGGCLDVVAATSVNLCADVGSDFADLTMTETYVKPLRE